MFTEIFYQQKVTEKNNLYLFRKIRKRYLRFSQNALPSQQAYALWATSYPATPHNALMQAEHQAMTALMPPLQDQVVLDMACGTGRWGQWALERGATTVIGVDDSRAMLARATLPHRIQANMTALPLPNMSVDVVLCGLATGHLQTISMQMALKEIGRVLRPQGVALISDFHPVLAWSGAQRTFTAPNRHVYVVEHHIHNYADYFEAATQASLTITGVSEPTHADAPDEKPLVMVLRLTKG